jgi:adenylate cyclase
VSIVLGPATAKALQDHFVMIELDRIAVKGRAEESAIFTIVAPAAQQQDPAVAELMELHPQLLDSIRGGRRVDALDLIQRCRPLAPSLSKYYKKLLLKAAAIPE